MPFFLRESTARDLSGLIVSDKKKPQINPSLPTQDSLYHSIVAAVIMDEWELVDTHLGWRSKLALFREINTISDKRYPVYAKGGDTVNNLGKKEPTPPPYGRGLPVTVVDRGGFTVLGVLGTHLLGKLSDGLIQNETRDAEASVSVGSPYISSETSYRASAPFLREKQTLKKNTLVAIAINIMSQKWEIIAGEC